MFTKRLFQKAVHRHQRNDKSLLTSDDVNLRINVHYGVPSTASILAFDPIQRLLAIGTLDGRIKVIGGDNIEGLLISPKLLPYKYLEFLQNQGFIVSITNDNDIQIWNLERRSIACSLQWESNVTAFSVIRGSSFMYVGDEYGMVSVLKYDLDSGQLLRLHYELSSDSLAEAIGVSISNRQPIVGLLLQPCSLGNRLLIAYELGLIILWDVVEANVVVVRGDKVLQLKNKVVPPNDGDIGDDAPSLDLEEKEISALCWASSDGSILAVGYVDGDILFWNTSKDSSTKDQEAGLSPNVVKLQLSSAEKRLPIIVLQWMDNSKSRKHQEGQLLIYGGDEIGSEEVVTVLSLEWSSGMESVRSIGRTDISLTGSFADMILIPSAGTNGSDANASLFVLSNPGHIHIYDGGSLSSSDTQSKKEVPVSAVKFPATIPTIDPLMTVAKLFHVYGSIEGLGFKKTAPVNSTSTLPGNKRWPLTGGVSNHLALGKDNKGFRLFVAGYQDGSVRIWDVTYPVFSLLCVLTAEANSKSLAGPGSSLTTINLCSSTLKLAVGSECGRVQLYNLNSSNEMGFHFVTQTKSEVCSSAQVQGPRCVAVFELQKSGVAALKFMNHGSRLIVGYECSRIAVLDVQSSTVAFITDSISNSPLTSISSKASVCEMAKTTNESPTKATDKCRGETIFVLTKDASIYVINGNNGSMISSRPVQLKKSTAISMYVIEKQSAVYESIDEQQLERDHLSKNELSSIGAQGSEKHEAEDSALDKNSSAQSLKELFVLVCCKESLRIYPAKSVVQGQNKSIYKVELSKPCCWTSIFRKDDKVCGLVVFYQTGEMEIRSLPELELVKELSVLSDLRWNFKANMERMISSTEHSHIALINGCEVAFISLLEGENDFRIPESLPSLQDEVLAAAANAAINVSSDHKIKQGGKTGILGGIVKGLRVPKSNKTTHHDSNSKANFGHLEDIFEKNQIQELLTADESEAAELTIDDIEIDEPGPSTSTSAHGIDNKNKDKRSEREKLFEDGTEITPRIRTKEEIIAKYRKVGDASAAAGQAKDKLLERREKLERISRRTEDLRNGAEDFASLANELVKAMENRKWYHI